MVGEADQLDSVAEFIRSRFPQVDKASVLVIAGSGLGGFVKAIKVISELNYGDIPGVGSSTVKGHAGKLLHAKSGNIPLVVMSGRRHLYEGLSAKEAGLLLNAVLLAFPSLKRVIISNAAGGLNPLFDVGDLMLITDQLNWMFRNPLIGPNRDDIGPRFPDVCNLYSRDLGAKARKTASGNGVVLRQGVYVGLLGPSYETRAEVAMLRHLLGGDAVGMSTVPEALIAAHSGREVLGISFISNTLAIPSVTSHAEVVENALLVETRFSKLITDLLPEIHIQG